MISRRRFDGVFRQIRLRFRHVHQASQQHGEFVARRQSKVANFSFHPVRHHDQRGNPVDSVLAGDLTVGRDFVNFEMQLVRQRHDLLEKRARVLARGTILAAWNDQRRVPLREK